MTGDAEGASPDCWARSGAEQDKASASANAETWKRHVSWDRRKRSNIPDRPQRSRGLAAAWGSAGEFVAQVFGFGFVEKAFATEKGDELGRTLLQCRRVVR